MTESSCEHCDHCNQNKYMAERLDNWESAFNTLHNKKWPEETPPDQNDVLALARFLSGE